MSTAELSDRLALSRERMRQAMQGKPAPRSGGAFVGDAAGAPLPWLQSLRSLPIAGVVFDAVLSWWEQHPLRIGFVVASSAAKALARPIAQRNPLGLVLGTFLLGGLVMWSRPWRWLLKPALFAGLLPQLVNKVLARLPSQACTLAMDLVAEASGYSAHLASAKRTCPFCSMAKSTSVPWASRK